MTLTKNITCGWTAENILCWSLHIHLAGREVAGDFFGFYVNIGW